MTIYDNSKNVRSRKMDWMRHSEWPWYIIFVDAYSETTPRLIIINWSSQHSFLCMPFGASAILNQINGPPPLR